MAEVLKEFVNKTITAADLSANNQDIVLFTNTGTSQAIVRGIDVASGAKITSTKAKLYVGNHPVMDTFESAEGSLLVDVGQSLVLKLNNAITSQSITSIPLTHQSKNSNTFTYKKYTYTIAPSGVDFTPANMTSGLVAGTDYSSEITTSPFASNYHGRLYRNSAGSYWAYYMDSNSISYIIKSSDGSSWTNVDTTNYSGPAIDLTTSSPRIYRKSGSTLAYWDASLDNTGQAGTYTNLESGNTSYQTASVQEGVYFHAYSGSSGLGSFKVFNNNYYGNLATYGHSITTQSKIVTAYNSEENSIYYFFWTERDWASAGSGQHFARIPKSILQSNSSNNQSINAQATTGTATDRYFIIQHNASTSSILGETPHTNSYSTDFKHLGGPYVSFPLDANTIRIAKCENNALTTVEDVPINWLGGSKGVNNYSYLVNDGPVIAGTYSPSQMDLSTQVRIVGIEMT